MKKIISLLLSVAVFIFSFTACSSNTISIDSDSYREVLAQLEAEQNANNNSATAGEVTSEDVVEDESSYDVESDDFEESTNDEDTDISKEDGSSNDEESSEDESIEKDADDANGKTSDKEESKDKTDDKPSNTDSKIPTGTESKNPPSTVSKKPIVSTNSSNAVSSVISSSNSSVVTGGVIFGEGLSLLDKEASEKDVATSITMTYNDAACRKIGFTWNTGKKITDQSLQVSEGAKFNTKKYVSFDVETKTYQSYKGDGTTFDYYVSKAVATGLTKGKTYTYRVYSKSKRQLSTPTTFTLPKSSDEVFTFVHLSDSQKAETDAAGTSYSGVNTGDDLYNAFMGSMFANNNDVDFYLHTGDIVEWSKYESYWTNMLNFNRQFFRAYPVMAISGNHEVDYQNGVEETFKHFNVDVPSANASTEKGYYYHFDYNNVRFIMLNTNEREENKIKEEQIKWLEDVLKNNPQKWTIVSMHHPMYSLGKWGADPAQYGISMALREQLTGLLAKYNVDLVLQGHDHTFSKTYPINEEGKIAKNYKTHKLNGVEYAENPNGVIYAVNGTSGSQTRAAISNADTSLYETYVKESSSKSAWAEITVTERTLTVKGYYYNNGRPKLWTSYGISKR